MLYPQKRFNGVLLAFVVGRYVDTTATIKRRAGRSNGVYGGVMMWGVRAVYSCPVFFALFGLIWAA